MKVRIPAVIAALSVVTCVASCSGAMIDRTIDPGASDDGSTELHEDAAPPDASKAADGAAPYVRDGSLPPRCPSIGTAEASPKISSGDIDEVSGIVSSARSPGVFWVHNDSGDSARAFAIDSAGSVLATVEFSTTKPTDIEDMAIDDESPAASSLYFGDIGDNDAKRAALTIHRVVEPKVGGGAPVAQTTTSETMTVVYEDGPHNAETLLFDPTTRDLLIATKKVGGPSDIHRVGAFTAGAKVTTTKIASVPIDLATGGDISRDGRYIAIRGYGTLAYVWVREPGESLAIALSREPCQFPIAAETQGEAFGFLSGNEGYVTISEGKSPRLHTSRYLP